ncbi:MAG TPA: dihydrodipicolinate synthase family protein [Planctomycetaceae bacterium]|nr:dihydrodipicolinate synthase family protein [Planctomycetaceae bacterium]
MLVGVTDTAFAETIRLAERAARFGAEAVVLSTPYYFPAGQTELFRYFGEVVRLCPLPVMLYNIPSLTKVAIELPTLQRLAESPAILGVKDSSGDQDYFRQLIGLKQQRPDWSILVGPEHLTAWAVRLGGDGGVNGGANIFPELFSALYSAARGNEDVTVSQIQDVVNELQGIYEVGKYASRFIKATKCAVSLRGICLDRLAEPFNHFMPPERQRVAEIIAKVETSLAELKVQ